MNKLLYFCCRGEWYVVNESGHLIQESRLREGFSGNWFFLGVSSHHWKQGVDLYFKDAFSNPKAIIGGLVWDKDSGTTRSWRGMYNGKLPRITGAYTKEV